jgi:hypothetical protein
VTAETAAAGQSPQTSGELFIARVPELEYRIGELIASDFGHWQPTGEATGGVIGIAHGRGEVEGMGGMVTVATWYGRDPQTGEVFGAHGMRVLGSGPFIKWPAGGATAEGVQFKRQTGKRRELPVDFATALLVASIVLRAEPIGIPEPPKAKMLLARASEMWANAVRVIGETNGQWPHHP